MVNQRFSIPISDCQLSNLKLTYFNPEICNKFHGASTKDIKMEFVKNKDLTIYN